MAVPRFATEVESIGIEARASKGALDCAIIVHDDRARRLRRLRRGRRIGWRRCIARRGRIRQRRRNRQCRMLIRADIAVGEGGLRPRLSPLIGISAVCVVASAYRRACVPSGKYPGEPVTLPKTGSLVNGLPPQPFEPSNNEAVTVTLLPEQAPPLLWLAMMLLRMLAV